MWKEAQRFFNLYGVVQHNKAVFEREIFILTKLLGMPEAIRDVFVKCCHWRALKRTDGARELAEEAVVVVEEEGEEEGGEEIPCFIHPPLLQ